MSEETDCLIVKGLHRSFRQGDEIINVLRGVDFSLSRGEMVGLAGPSGSGKSTLLQITGLLERPDSGNVYLNGVSCWSGDDNSRTKLRQTQLGFVYQFHHLLAEFTALENVMLPQMAFGVPKKSAAARGKALLTKVGLENRIGHLPAELSGGEQQRVAIVRALSNKPAVVLADEPTGNLDEKTAFSVFDLLQEITRSFGVSLLIATHNPALVKKMDRVLTLNEGRLG
ncbi:MAG: ABC transporter ATP-binding protein [Rhodospirillaceae bacterium]